MLNLLFFFFWGGVSVWLFFIVAFYFVCLFVCFWLLHWLHWLCSWSCLACFSLSSPKWSFSSIEVCSTRLVVSHSKHVEDRSVFLFNEHQNTQPSCLGSQDWDNFTFPFMISAPTICSPTLNLLSGTTILTFTHILLSNVMWKKSQGLNLLWRSLVAIFNLSCLLWHATVKF